MNNSVKTSNINIETIAKKKDLKCNTKLLLNTNRILIEKLFFLKMMIQTTKYKRLQIISIIIKKVQNDQK